MLQYFTYLIINYFIRVSNLFLTGVGLIKIKLLDEGYSDSDQMLPRESLF